MEKVTNFPRKISELLRLFELNIPFIQSIPDDAFAVMNELQEVRVSSKALRNGETLQELRDRTAIRDEAVLSLV
eukprot:snap_masked-scaffold_5-processed-gene-7.15-mRNA-1 protein AED:1.00 eAED:1.00 QI:0/-1/0/0/-1/1/1/0/73